VERPCGQALHAPLEEERRDAFVLLRAVDRREHEEVVGQVGQRDPDLLAVEPVSAAVATRRRRKVAGVGPDAGLGQSERRQLLALRLRDEPALALLLGPPLKQSERVQPDVDALDDAERGVGPLKLLAQDRERDVVHAGAAIALRDRRAEEALLGHPPEQLAGKAAVLVPAPDVGEDLRLGERANGLLDEAVLVGEREVDHRADASGRDAGRVVRQADQRTGGTADSCAAPLVVTQGGPTGGGTARSGSSLAACHARRTNARRNAAIRLLVRRLSRPGSLADPGTDADPGAALAYSGHG
jgi:hypothetical protein